MNINTTKIISLLFFIFSAFYLYTAYQIQVFAFDENAPFNARTFPIYLGYVGLFFSGLKIILPDLNTIKVNHKKLEYKKTGILILIAIIYGATILKVGYFLTTYQYGHINSEISFSYDMMDQLNDTKKTSYIKCSKTQ